jgi:hypothetical protein
MEFRLRMRRFDLEHYECLRAGAGAGVGVGGDEAAAARPGQRSMLGV